MTKGKLIKNLKITVPIYYYIDDVDSEGKRIIHIDDEAIKEDFDDQFGDILSIFDEQDANSE